MPQTLANLLTHFVFSTRDRQPFITPELLPRLHPYLGKLIAGEGGTALGIGGTADHVHLLVRTPARLAPSDLVRVIKPVSSGWVRKEHGLAFGWQAGFGAFSVSQSNVEDVLHYIADQAAHHRTMTFQEEYRAFLRRHEINFDERYVWD